MAKHSNLPRVRKTSTSTRDALIRAAEQLMAAHGIEGVELREINRLAGQRNSSAVHYHFTDREGLIAAIRDKHRPAITADRQRRLDELADGPDVSINDLVRALVEPMSAPLATASGRDFLIIAAESAGRIGSHALLTSDLPYNAGLARINQLLLDRIAGTADRREALVRHVVLTSAGLLADVARDIKAGRTTAATRGDRVQSIVDFIANGLAGGSQPTKSAAADSETRERC